MRRAPEPYERWALNEPRGAPEQAADDYLALMRTNGVGWRAGEWRALNAGELAATVCEVASATPEEFCEVNADRLPILLACDVSHAPATARAFCETAHGGVLARVRSEADAQRLLEVTAGFLTTSVWLDGSDAANEGVWVDKGGTPYPVDAYSNWSGYPLPGGPERAVVLQSGTGLWFEAEDSEQHLIVCRGALIGGNPGCDQSPQTGFWACPDVLDQTRAGAAQTCAAFTDGMVVPRDAEENADVVFMLSGAIGYVGAWIDVYDRGPGIYFDAASNVIDAFP